MLTRTGPGLAFNRTGGVLSVFRIRRFPFIRNELQFVFDVASGSFSETDINGVTFLVWHPRRYQPHHPWGVHRLRHTPNAGARLPGAAGVGGPAARVRDPPAPAV